MKFSKTLIPTLKEIPNDCDADNISQVLMARAGLIRRMSNGLYMYMPLMTRVMANIEREIRNAMSSVNCCEVRFPILVQKETLVESNRWNLFGDIMFKLKDRAGKELSLSPTNEEAACFVARHYIKSYNNLPFAVYQLQKKFRDEIRPKGGVIRTREFTMKDAYSFHANDEDLAKYFHEMRDAYTALFARLGLETVVVSADMGVMGGNYSCEVMALSNSGTDIIGVCSSCGNADNCEVLPCKPTNKPLAKSGKAIKKIHTPNSKTIEELTASLKTTPDKFCKSIIYKADDNLILALVRGDHEINEIKLARVMGANSIELADRAQAESTLSTIIGFVGPVNLESTKTNKVRIIADLSVKNMADFIVGANEIDYHLINVNNTDFNAEYADIRMAREGDTCDKCGKPLKFSNAYELGHVFALGDHYSKKLNLTYVTRDNTDQTLHMGCYGIGVERTVAALIEQYNDERGICWPAHVAPIVANVITINPDDAEQLKKSKEVYSALSKDYDILWDDRAVSPGVKFKDSDLIGVPLNIVIGKNIQYDKIELITRAGEKTEIPLSNAISEIQNKIAEIIKESKERTK